MINELFILHFYWNGSTFVMFCNRLKSISLGSIDVLLSFISGDSSLLATLSI